MSKSTADVVEIKHLLRQLLHYDDRLLNEELIAKKYHGLCLAATLLCAVSEFPGEQRYWSRMGIEYGRIAAEARFLWEGSCHSSGSSMPEEPDALDSIRARVLVAMALNYYQRDWVTENDLVAQFDEISEDWLIGSGFCRHKVLRAMAADGIVEIPGFGPVTSL